VTKNSGKYRYYRIYWTNGGGINANGYSNEVYFELPSNYNANLNPKVAFKLIILSNLTIVYSTEPLY
jgi:hypothetical protein